MTFMPPMFEESRRRWRRTDRIVRLLIANWALGMGLGAAMGGGLIVFDFLGLRTLLSRSDAALVGTIAFVALFAFSFGGVVAAAAVMRAGQDDDDEPRGGLRAPALIYATAPRGAR
jgi:hypothetical protein